MDWCSEGQKAVRVLGVATLVFLDHRPLQFPLFSQRHGVGEACSLFEASPCEPVAMNDIPFSLVVFFPSSSWPPTLQRKGGLLWIGVPEGRNVVQAPGVATLVLLDRSPLQFPHFCEGMRLGRLELVATFDLYFFHLVFYPFLPFGVPSFTDKRGNCRGLALGKD